MSEKPKQDRPLTLDSCVSPHGFQSLAAAALMMLRKHGKAFLYVDDDGNVLHKDPDKEIAIAHVPSLLVDPSAVLDYDKQAGTMTVRLDGVQVLNYSALELEVEGDNLEQDDGGYDGREY